MSRGLADRGADAQAKVVADVGATAAAGSATPAASGTPAAKTGRPANLPAPLQTCILGTGMALPETILTNEDLAQRVATSDEWIYQRTKMRERRIASEDQSVVTLGRDALNAALNSSGLQGADLDFVICASMSSPTACPSAAARIAAEVGAAPGGAMDLTAACSGFVYALNLAATMVHSGFYRRVGVVGAETMSRILNWEDRRTCVLFGDGAGAAVVARADDSAAPWLTTNANANASANASVGDGAADAACQADGNAANASDSSPSVASVALGCIYQSMSSDGAGWPELYIPPDETYVPEGCPAYNGVPGKIQMNGREVYKFAVKTLLATIKDALSATGLKAEALAAIVAHQSNGRIIESASERLRLPEGLLYVNIDRYANTSAASAAICLNELVESGRIQLGSGKPVLMVAMGGGLTWANSVWRL